VFFIIRTDDEALTAFLGEQMDLIVYRPFGFVRSPLKGLHGGPIQSVAAGDIEGVIEVFPQYAEGLRDIEGFSHLILIYHFHLCNGRSLTVRPTWTTRCMESLPLGHRLVRTPLAYQ
jgi:tRNA (Thr-GGU) A37 N-methylase